MRFVVFDDHAAYWVVLDLREEGFIAIRHDEVSRHVPARCSKSAPMASGRSSSVKFPTSTGRSGSRRSVCASTTATRRGTADVGERVPVGFDLEWDEGHVVGELLVGRSRVPFDGRGTFVRESGGLRAVPIGRTGSTYPAEQCVPGVGITPSTRYALTASSMQVLRAVP